MKKLTFLAALLIVTSASSFAGLNVTGEEPNAKPKFQMIAKSDVKFDFYYASENAGEVSVNIFNEHGKKVSTKIVKNARKFRRTYDFSQLEPGKYNIVVKDKNGTASQKIEYKVKKAQLATFVSRIPNKKSIKVHVGNFNKDEVVRVKVYNENDKLIHSEKIRNERSFSRVYDLNNTSTKAVYVLIENNGERQSFKHSLN